MTKNLADELQRTARQALAGLQPSQQGEEPGGMPVRRLLAAVFRGRYLLFGTTMFGLLVGAFLGITTPNTYVSEGKFLFQSVGAERETVGPGATSQTSQESIATGASYVLDSDDLLHKVVAKLTPDRILQPYQPGSAADSGAKGLFFSIQREWNATKASDRTEDAALKQLKRSISMDRPRGTDVLVVRYMANDPKLAQEVLQTWMGEAIQWHIEKYENVKAYEAAQKNYEDSLLARERASKALEEFLIKRAKVSRFEEEKERLEKAEVEALTEHSKLEAEFKASKSELARLVQALDVDHSVKLTIPMSVQLDTTEATRKQLEEKMAKAAADKVELLASSEQSAPARRASLEKLIQGYNDELQRLLAEKAKAPQIESSAPNPEYAKKQERRGELQTQIGTLEEKVNAAAAYVTRMRSELAALMLLEPDFLRLRDAKAAAEEAFESNKLLWHLAQRKKELGAGAFSTLNNFQQASLPLEKEAPNRGKLVLGAVMVGLFFGFGVILLRSLPDTVVRTREDLEQIEGLAVIGLMPKLDGINLRRHAALREQGW